MINTIVCTISVISIVASYCSSAIRMLPTEQTMNLSFVATDYSTERVPLNLKTGILPKYSPYHGRKYSPTCLGCHQYVFHHFSHHCHTNSFPYLLNCDCKKYMFDTNTNVSIVWQLSCFCTLLTSVPGRPLLVPWYALYSRVTQPTRHNVGYFEDRGPEQ